ncbi:MAG: discoidin domain-containing protein [Acidimicrobiales bacterium]
MSRSTPNLVGRRSAVWQHLMAVGVTAAALVLLAACSPSDDSDSAADAEVLPFSEVQDSDFVFEADPADPDRGIFRVTTTEPMICAIIWGEDESFGNFNNSLAMSGTGIVEHDVLLPGAEPGRTYVFRVQGSTADGRQFRSETGTFTIPESGTEPTPERTGTNLALDATVSEASSEFGADFGAELAIDGDGQTEWSSAGDGDDAYITIDLGAPAEVGGVEFVTRSMADGSAIAETFTVTVDGGEPLGPFPAATPAEVEVAEVETTGQVFRFDVDRSTGGNVGAVEVRILAP